MTRKIMRYPPKMCCHAVTQHYEKKCDQINDSDITSGFLDIETMFIYVKIKL